MGGKASPHQVISRFVERKIAGAKLRQVTEWGLSVELSLH
jgi:hypothetical protein